MSEVGIKNLKLKATEITLVEAERPKIQLGYAR